MHQALVVAKCPEGHLGRRLEVCFISSSNGSGLDKALEIAKTDKEGVASKSETASVLSLPIEALDQQLLISFSSSVLAFNKQVFSSYDRSRLNVLEVASKEYPIQAKKRSTMVHIHHRTTILCSTPIRIVNELTENGLRELINMESTSKRSALAQLREELARREYRKPPSPYQHTMPNPIPCFENPVGPSSVVTSTQGPSETSVLVGSEAGAPFQNYSTATSSSNRLAPSTQRKQTSEALSFANASGQRSRLQGVHVMSETGHEGDPLNDRATSEAASILKTLDVQSKAGAPSTASALRPPTVSPSHTELRYEDKPVKVELRKRQGESLDREGPRKVAMSTDPRLKVKESNMPPPRKPLPVDFDRGHQSTRSDRAPPKPGRDIASPIRPGMIPNLRERPKDRKQGNVNSLEDDR